MAPRRYLFDRWGNCLGHIDDRGFYFDRGGLQVAQVGSDGEVIDSHGTRRGHIDVQGQFWDAHGRSIGYLGPRVPAPTSGLLIGSIAEKVGRASPVLVLTVRPPH